MLMSRPTALLLIAAAALVPAARAPAQAPPAVPPTVRPPAPPATQVDDPLARDVRRLLADGKAVEALALTEREFKTRPNDPTVRSAYLELRMAIARQAIAAQKFAQAQTILDQVVAAQPDHPTAGKMLAMIQQARARLDQALADAGDLLRLERFEQSSALLAQTAGLVPDQPHRWQQAWLTAAVGAGDDHYLMRNYEAALPFYTQALELSAGHDNVREDLLWRWSHCYAMNLARTADVPRSQGHWAEIIDQAKDRFSASKAELLGQFLIALGRENLGDYGQAIPAYRQLLGPAAPPRQPTLPPQREAALLRTKTIEYVDGLNRGDQINRRGGAWAAVLPGDPLTRQTARVVVTAHNDLAARRVLEAVTYHAPRLARYLGGGPEDLNWDVDYRVIVQPTREADAHLAGLAVPSYTRIVSQGGRLVRHETVCWQADPLLLGATVPHELTHVLLSRLAGYPPVPLAIDEGMAIHAETTARYLMFHRTLIESGGPKLTVAQLLAADALPAPKLRAAFYAECYSLVAWLLTQRDPAPPAASASPAGPGTTPPPAPPGRAAGGETVAPVARIVELCRQTRQMPPTAALLKVYGFPDMATAEKAYRTFLEDQGLLRPAVPAGP